jgi:membrane associated rhomboid family serine protease
VIPLKDNIPTSRFPILTVALIVINVGFYIWQLSYPTDEKLDEVGFSNIDQSSIEYGAIPYRVTHPDAGDCSIGSTSSSGQAAVVCPGTPEFTEAEESGEANPNLAPLPVDQAPWWVTIFTSMFMHGSILHIGFNMLFLWVFGNNIEDAMGRVKFIFFYLLAGITAVYAQSALDIDSAIPQIGASGAVAGVLGAYLLLHPKAKVLTLIFIIFLVTLVEIPAWILLAIWFVLQFVPLIADVASPAVGGEGGVAYLAHVGGFIFGLAAVKLFARNVARPEEEPRLPVY